MIEVTEKQFESMNLAQRQELRRRSGRLGFLRRGDTYVFFENGDEAAKREALAPNAARSARLAAIRDRARRRHAEVAALAEKIRNAQGVAIEDLRKMIVILMDSRR